MRTLENTIRERGSTALYALVSVDTVYTVVMVRGELIVSRNYRMLIYRTFQIIEENIVSNLQYRVSSILKNCDFFVFFASRSLTHSEPRSALLAQMLIYFPEEDVNSPRSSSMLSRTELKQQLSLRRRLIQALTA